MCEACEAAERSPTCGLYDARCDGCKARAIARGTDLFDARKLGDMTSTYRNALAKVFGDSQAQITKGHEMVKRWARRPQGRA